MDIGGEQIFIILASANFVIITSVLFFRGKKALSIFPELERVHVLFREKWASGYSTKLWKTKAGGAQNVLEVVITESELWLKCPTVFAGVGRSYDLIHKLKIEEIQSVELNQKDKTIVIKLKEKHNPSGPFILKLKKGKEFLEILKPKLV
jgi:hypothetical protein